MMNNHLIHAQQDGLVDWPHNSARRSEPEQDVQNPDGSGKIWELNWKTETLDIFEILCARFEKVSKSFVEVD